MALVIGNDLNSPTALNTVHVSHDCHLIESSWDSLPNTRISGTKVWETSSVAVNVKERLTYADLFQLQCQTQTFCPHLR